MCRCPLRLGHRSSSPTPQPSLLDGDLCVSGCPPAHHVELSAFTSWVLGLEAWATVPVCVVFGTEARLQAWEASILSTTLSTHLRDHFKRIFKQTKLNKVFLIFFTFTSQLFWVTLWCKIIGSPQSPEFCLPTHSSSEALLSILFESLGI